MRLACKFTVQHKLGVMHSCDKPKMDFRFLSCCPYYWEEEEVEEEKDLSAGLVPAETPAAKAVMYSPSLHRKKQEIFTVIIYHYCRKYFQVI